jgi:hypothetical protein
MSDVDCVDHLQDAQPDGDDPGSNHLQYTFSSIPRLPSDSTSSTSPTHSPPRASLTQEKAILTIEVIEPIKVIEPIELLEPIGPIERIQPIEPIEPMQSITTIAPIEPIEPPAAPAAPAVFTDINAPLSRTVSAAIESDNSDAEVSIHPSLWISNSCVAGDTEHCTTPSQVCACVCVCVRVVLRLPPNIFRYLVWGGWFPPPNLPVVSFQTGHFPHSKLATLLTPNWPLSSSLRPSRHHRQSTQSTSMDLRQG